MYFSIFLYINIDITEAFVVSDDFFVRKYKPERIAINSK